MKVKQLSKIFKALGDENRLKVFALIVQQGSVCVCEVSDTFEFSQPLASKYLKQLREAGLVDVKKEGKWSIYFLKRDPFVDSLTKSIEDISLPPLKRCQRC